MECQLSESCQLQESSSIWQDNDPNSQVAGPNQHARTTHQDHPLDLHTGLHFGCHRPTLSTPGAADQNLPSVQLCEPQRVFSS